MKQHTQKKPTIYQQIPQLTHDQSLILLQKLHILTQDGHINQDTRRKLKQVLHLVQFVRPLLSLDRSWVLVDHGAGKSYFGFILYDLIMRQRLDHWVVGIETRNDLVIKSQQLAQDLGFDRMRFLACRSQDVLMGSPEQIQAHFCQTQLGLSPTLSPSLAVTALHACDTATDEAIDFGLALQAEFMVLIPCCQAELARTLNANKQHDRHRPLTELWRHPHHTREFASHLTNVLRCLKLQAHGYDVQVTELIGWEHAMKNELIIAKKRPSHQPSLAVHAARQLSALLQEVGLQDHSIIKRFI